MEKHPLKLFLIKATDEPYYEPWRPGLMKFAIRVTLIIVVLIFIILVFI